VVPRLQLPFLLLAATLCGCPTDPDPTLDVELTVTASQHVPTVVTVSWPVVNGDRDGQHVEYGLLDKDPRGLAPAPVTDGVATAVLRGLKPSSEYQVFAAEAVHGLVLRSAVHTLATGSPPPDLPDLGLDEWSDEHHAGYVITSVITEQSTVVVLDADGAYVWWHRLSPPDGAAWDDFHVPGALLTRDRAGIVYQAMTAAEVDDDIEVERQLVQVSLDGSRGDTTAIPRAHHDLAELSDGTLALLEADVRLVDGEPIEGDRLVELSPLGETSEVWSVWDHLALDPDTAYDPDVGWSGAVAVEYAPATDRYLVSLANLDTIHEIDRVSGDLVRVIGGEHSDVVLDDGSTALFDNQHGVAALVDSILVFDNQDPEHGSRVVEYRIDDETAVAELVWEHAAASGLYSGSFGDACRLPSGNTLVAFSGAGEIGEVDPGGAVLWRLTAPDEVTFGYVQYVDSLY